MPSGLSPFVQLDELVLVGLMWSYPRLVQDAAKQVATAAEDPQEAPSISGQLLGAPSISEQFVRTAGALCCEAGLADLR